MFNHLNQNIEMFFDFLQGHGEEKESFSKQSKLNFAAKQWIWISQ